MLFSVDRIEGQSAVLIAENRDSCIVSLDVLPANAAEGKMYRKVGDAFIEDTDTEKARQERVRALQSRLRGHKN